MSNNHSFAQADAPRRHGMNAGCTAEMGLPLQAGAMDRLVAWFSGDIALTRAEAHRLMACAVESGQIADHHGEFVAAIKALAVGSRSWNDMGYRLLPDD